MLFLLMCLLTGAGTIIGFLVGRSSKKDPEAISRRERKELDDLRTMRLDLIAGAAEAAVLPDETFAVQALARLNRKEITS